MGRKSIRHRQGRKSTGWEGKNKEKLKKNNGGLGKKELPGGKGGISGGQEGRWCMDKRDGH